MKMRRLGSSSFCPRRHNQRASATSPLSCSLANSVFFEADRPPLEELRQGCRVDRHAVLRMEPFGQNIECHFGISKALGDQPVGMSFQPRCRCLTRRAFNLTCLAPMRHPSDRCRNTDVEANTCFARRRPLANRINHTASQLRSIPSRHNNLQNTGGDNESAFRSIVNHVRSKWL